MVDVGSIAAAVAGLKSATDLAASIFKLKSVTEIQGKVVELQTVILSAQASAIAANADQFTLLGRVGDLEKEIAGLKAWDTEKKRYELKQIQPGIFAYSLKPASADSEPPHWLCTNCYEQGHKSILQSRSGLQRVSEHHCPKCKSTLTTYFGVMPQ